MAKIYVIIGVMGVSLFSMGCRYEDSAGLHTSISTSSGTNQVSSAKPADFGPSARELSKGHGEGHESGAASHGAPASGHH